MSEKPSFKRKKIVVDPALQGRLVRDITSAPLVALIGGAIVVSILLQVACSEVASLEIELPALRNLTIAIALFVIACGVVILYHGLQVSHRIAGPLFRIHRTMQQLRRGEFSGSIRLRDADYLHATADEINQMAEHLRAQSAELAALRARFGAAAAAPDLCEPESLAAAHTPAQTVAETPAATLAD